LVRYPSGVGNRYSTLTFWLFRLISCLTSNNEMRKVVDAYCRTPTRSSLSITQVQLILCWPTPFLPISHLCPNLFVSKRPLFRLAIDSCLRNVALNSHTEFWLAFMAALTHSYICVCVYGCGC
jgi:hypothetical protein